MISPFPLSLPHRLRRIFDLTRQIYTSLRMARLSRFQQEQGDVIFFNASTRLSGLSQNAAFSLIASWIIRLSGVPVVHFICKRGLQRCVLGTDENDLSHPMPCGMCLRQSRINFSFSRNQWFTFHPDKELAVKLENLDLEQLLAFKTPFPFLPKDLPLGELVLPSLRWRMRLHTLVDDEQTRTLCRQFMLSAWNVASEFAGFLTSKHPRAVVLFNGTHFPEAAVAWVSQQKGLRVITHESGFQPFSGYFVEGEATTYPINIPEVDLTPAQNARLDADLQKRWQGDFSMAGIQFFPEMHQMPEVLQKKISGYRQMVAIFTNVIFDTTQMYANTVFSSMFDWLDHLLPVVESHADTLFVLRAHPDEARLGKASRESVASWFKLNAPLLPNIYLISPGEHVNSYDLVGKSKFVLTYNSTIGLEAILHAIPVLAAGQAPFNAHTTVFYQTSQAAYLANLDRWLASGKINVPSNRLVNTRRFLYYRTYRFSLPFAQFLEATRPVGYVRLKKFTIQELKTSQTAKAILGGILEGKRFEIDV